MDAVVTRRQRQFPAVDCDARRRIDAIVARCQRQLPALDHDVALLRFLIVAGLQPVAAHVHGDRAVLDGERVPALEAVVDCVHGDVAARNLEVILARDAVLVVRVDGEAAHAVDREVVVAEDRGVGFIRARVRINVLASVRDRVLSALCQGDHHLLGVGHVDRRARGRINVRAVQEEHDLLRVLRVDDDLPVVQLAADTIRAGRRDGEGRALHRRASARIGDPVAGELDVRHGCARRGALGTHVQVRVVVIDRGRGCRRGLASGSRNCFRACGAGGLCGARRGSRSRYARGYRRCGRAGAEAAGQGCG